MRVIIGIFSAALFSSCVTPLDYWTLVGRWMKVLALTRNDLTRFVIQTKGPDGKWTRKPLAYRESNNVQYTDTHENFNMLTLFENKLNLLIEMDFFFTLITYWVHFNVDPFSTA